MKIQYLAVIFILIIMPITIVFGEYINTQMTFASTENIYDQRLLNSTHDAVKAFQINTLNTPYYSPQVRVSHIDGAVNTFFDSLKSAFKYDGNARDVMKEYVPAVVFTMYDGYYVYSPYKNTLTGLDLGDVDKDYLKNGNSDGKVLDGLKPYVSYTCKYQKAGKTFMITYSMDNYIHVDIFDGEQHLTNGGYLLNVQKDDAASTETYTYGGVNFKASAKGKLNEFIPEMTMNDDGTYTQETETINGDKVVKLKKYYYTVRDGTKYYYEDNGEKNKKDANDRIFYIANDGTRVSQVSNYENNKERFDDYYNEIFGNLSAFYYYKEAYEFKQWFKKNVGNLSTINIVNGVNYTNYDFVEITNIFDFTKSEADDGSQSNIEESDSKFNRHRADVIRAIITTNLTTAISGFTKYSNTDEEFLMPKISETDWELLENNICVASFFQGIRIGGKRYNGYAVVPNAYNKEYIDENDIYILKSDGTYAKPNEIGVGGNLAAYNGYQSAVHKIDLEKRLANYEMNDYYIPLCTDKDGLHPYLASYASIVGSTEIVSIKTSDMYRYIKGQSSNALKTAYFFALGRTRKGSFKYTINGIENILNCEKSGNKVIIHTQPNKTIQAYGSISGEGGAFKANDSGEADISQVANASSGNFYVIIDGQKFHFKNNVLQH